MSAMCARLLRSHTSSGACNRRFCPRDLEISNGAEEWRHRVGLRHETFLAFGNGEETECCKSSLAVSGRVVEHYLPRASTDHEQGIERLLGRLNAPSAAFSPIAIA